MARLRNLAVTLAALALLACDATPQARRGPNQSRPMARSDVGAVSDAALAADASADAAMPRSDGGVSPAPDGGVSPAPDAGAVPDSGAPRDSGATGPRDSGAPRPDSGVSDPGPAVLNPGWIGGPCTGNSDCNFTGGTCLTAAAGYPDGTCTQACTRLCPDRSGPLNSVTFCANDGRSASEGSCLSRCDFTLSPQTGCRRGYVCLPEKRMNQSSVVRHVCVPRSGLPGRPTPPFDIGDACIGEADCERNTCLGLPGGYCSQEACNIVGCPTGSTCFRLGLENFYACLKSCTSSTQCRQAENYTCDPQRVCWYAPPQRPPCVRTGAAADCATYAARASRNFAVVTKSKRRLVLCDGATAVATHCVGLGSSPVLDKEREGDRRTPEGIFYIPRLVPNSQYYKAFLLSYPDAEDARRGLAAGLITQSEHDSIVAAQSGRREPPQHTNLGGLIEIHGRDQGPTDWTWGCIAAQDSAIDMLWQVLGVGDTVVVLH